MKKGGQRKRNGCLVRPRELYVWTPWVPCFAPIWC